MTLKDEIQAVENQLSQAIAARDFDRLATLYTDNACLMPDGVPTCSGREALLGFFGGVCDSGIVATRFTTLDVEADGALAVETGRYELYAAHPSGDRQRVDAGRYLVVWRKVDGNWRIHRDMFNHAEPKQ